MSGLDSPAHSFNQLYQDSNFKLLTNAMVEAFQTHGVSSKTYQDSRDDLVAALTNFWPDLKGNSLVGTENLIADANLERAIRELLKGYKQAHPSDAGSLPPVAANSQGSAR